MHTKTPHLQKLSHHSHAGNVEKLRGWIWMISTRVQYVQETHRWAPTVVQLNQDRHYECWSTVVNLQYCHWVPIEPYRTLLKSYRTLLNNAVLGLILKIWGTPFPTLPQVPASIFFTTTEFSDTILGTNKLTSLG